MTKFLKLLANVNEGICEVKNVMVCSASITHSRNTKERLMMSGIHDLITMIGAKKINEFHYKFNNGSQLQFSYQNKLRGYNADEVILEEFEEL